MPHDLTPAASEAPPVAVLPDRFVERSKNAWGHCDSIVDLTPLKSPQCTGLFILETWAAAHCVFVQRAIDATSHVHEAKHLNHTGNVLFVWRFLSGHLMGRNGESPYSIYRGSIAMRDYSRPYDGVQSAAIIQGIVFLHETLGFDPGQHPGLSVFHDGSLFAQCLHAEFDTVFEQLGAGFRYISSDQMMRIKSCIQFAIHGKSSKADVRTVARQALKRTICINIEQNLGDLTFSPKSILTRFGTSRATLFRMFEADGGVRNYINNRRLYRAVLQISKSPMTRGVISKAARDWGFSSDANFNRSVRRVYGTSPNSLFEAPIQSVPVPKGSRSLWAEQRAQLMKRGQDAYAARQPF
ncbi:MAG: helix-turn-helix domain-containing protein [Pseudomonadota bacterium]